MLIKVSDIKTVLAVFLTLKNGLCFLNITLASNNN